MQPASKSLLNIVPAMAGLTFTAYRYSTLSIAIICSAFVLFSSGLFSCNNSSSPNQLIKSKQDSLAEEMRIAKAFIEIDTAKKIIHSGDMITRTGADFTSESLRSLNQRDQSFSHCGIASIENDSVFVYHALGGDFNPDQKILREPVEKFAEPQGNRGMGVFRYQLNPEETSNTILVIQKLYAAGVMFDMKFDLKSDDHMYCAEFVYKSYLLGTKGKLQFPSSHIKDFTFIGVDDLFLHPLCREQLRILFK